MTQSIIDIGDAPNDGTGDPVREAFNKCNNNFSELYAAGAVIPAGTATPPQGRLTLQTATPVMITTQSAKTTIYYTPYVGNKVPIYDGSTMTMTSFAELSVATTDTTKSPAAIGASKVNDWFVWSDAGTVRIGHGPDWTSDTVRSAGTALVMVNGILLNNASITNGPAASRGTYVGTTRSNASSQLDWIFGALSAGGTAGFFGVWNTYNRRQVATTVSNSTDSWTYATASWRQAAGSAGMQVGFVCGLNEDAVRLIYSASALSGSGVAANLGVGLDSTTVFSGLPYRIGTAVFGCGAAFYDDFPGIGFHTGYAIEYSQAGSTTFIGDNAIPLQLQGGLIFSGMM